MKELRRACALILEVWFPVEDLLALDEANSWAMDELPVRLDVEMAMRLMRFAMVISILSFTR